ncbi:ATP-binding protein [Paenibacillus algorifonticola]|uniref:ATP-binding protein n=1 Tax=Paenibacillus algorifonticola TaxID=684063 RepID=UPI003D2AEBA5
MSIRAKLVCLISVTVTVILLLNITIYYMSSKDELQQNAEQQMRFIGNQIAVSIASAEQNSQLTEDALGERLHAVAIAIQNKLDPDIKNVRNSELVQLSKELGVDHITLWIKTKDDILSVRSTNPDELYMSSKTWNYWYTAFTQLFEKHNVTIPEGQKLEHFWAGPINFGTSDPDKVFKWGNYYDGTTNYMINPYIHAQTFLDSKKKYGADAIVAQILRDKNNILEVTGFDPAYFGKAPAVSIKNGVVVYNLDVRNIIFGQYYYKDSVNDHLNTQKAIEKNEVVTIESKLNSKQVIKSFIPVQGPKPYVISITFNNSALQQTLMRQVLTQGAISLGLILATVLCSYFISGFMVRSLNQIVSKVNEISNGNFGARISLKSNDEFGVLANRVNAMGQNLHTYMNRLTESAEELRQTKQYLESFVNHTSDAIHVSNLHGSVIQMNKAFEKMYGWTEEELLGQPLNNTPPELEMEGTFMLEFIQQGGSVADYDTMRYDKSGRLLDVSITVSSIRDEQEQIIAIATISRNITARKQTEEVLRRSEKLSVVGQLAAGVAHEVRNPLTTLRGFVQLLKKNGQLAPAYIDVMLSELDRINFIVSEFLVFAKPQASRFQRANIHEIMRGIIMLLDSEANISNVQFTTRFDTEIPEMKCEVNQLKQVFVNIIKNGIEAMPEGGELDIDLSYTPSIGIIIRITDHGFGITEDNLSRLGEPFFTTKEEGNGLGLMVCYQIIANHRGSMSFQSKKGIGTQVEIRLPVIQDVAPTG